MATLSSHQNAAMQTLKRISASASRGMSTQRFPRGLSLYFEELVSSALSTSSGHCLVPKPSTRRCAGCPLTQFPEVEPFLHASSRLITFGQSPATLKPPYAGAALSTRRESPRKLAPVPTNGGSGDTAR